MGSESETPFHEGDFTIPVADRVRRLPPYLFGRINDLKQKKRSEGVDVIDLGMGNPTDPPDPPKTRPAPPFSHKKTKICSFSQI